MARLILDTSVVIHAHRRKLSIGDLYADGDDVAIAAVTASELLAGVELVHERRRATRKAEVEDVIASHTVEGFDLDTARVHAHLLAETRRAGHQRGAHDLLIAATAVARDRTIVTLDPKAFEGLPDVIFRSVEDAS